MPIYFNGPFYNIEKKKKKTFTEQMSLDNDNSNNNNSNPNNYKNSNNNIDPNMSTKIINYLHLLQKISNEK